MNLEERFLNSLAADLFPAEGSPNFVGPVPPAELQEVPMEEITLTPESPEAAARIAAGTSTPATVIGKIPKPAQNAEQTNVSEVMQPGIATGGMAAPEPVEGIQKVPRTKVEEFIGDLGAAIQSGAETIDFDVIGLPGIGSLTLKDLTVGDIGKVMEAMSYGFYPVTGAGQTLKPTPEALDLLNAIPAFKAASTAAKTGAKVIAKELAPTAANMMEAGLRKTGMIADIVPEGKWFSREEFKPYANQPRELKGFSRSSLGKSFDEQNYKHVEFVEVEMGDGSKHFDAIRGLNRDHAMARAFENWGSAKAIRTVPQSEIKKVDPELVKEVEQVMGKLPEVKTEKIKEPKAGKFDAAVFDEPIPVQPSVKSLSGSFDNALSSYLALPYEQQVAKTKEANAALAKYLGTGKDGKTKSLLGKNQKLMKTEVGAGGEEPIVLPDGRGVENAGLALSPAYKEGKFTTCPNSASCSEDCLGKTSGGYFFMGGGRDLNKLIGPRLESFKRTQAFMRDPENFAIKLHNEITAMKYLAAQNGNHLAIRLNVLSDINPRVHEQLIKAHPDVTFYDYTKNNTNPIAANHHYTYSSTGISQNVNGVEVVNPNQNWKQMRRRLDEGKNVAMAFSHKSLLPETILDEETGKVYKVINGDTHDFRPLDAVPQGVDGVIIGLKNKAATRTQENASAGSKGFFVHYDPQISKVKGKLARDEAGNLMVQNTQVKIPKQGAGQITMTNDYAQVKEAK